MQPFVRHTGVAAPLKESNVDTDQIVPSSFLKRVTKTGYDDALFYFWRKDADFVLNQEAYASASILVAGPDFGTGSSREHAVWALKDYGFRVVLASRFGDIFYGNSAKQGLLAGVVDQTDIEELWKRMDANPGVEVTVSVEDRTIWCGEFQCGFTLDDYTRWRLMEGLDDISLTLDAEAEIAAFESTRPSFLPQTI